MIVALLAAIFAVSGAAVIALRKRKPEPQGWSAGPVIGGKNYSAGVAIGADGSFDFPLAPHSVHYVTKGCGPLSPNAELRLRYRIEAAPGARFLPASDAGAPSIGPVPYVQRAGDDWSGTGKFEAYRWWATFAAPSPIGPGEHEMVVPLGGRWTAVETSNAVDQRPAFLDALANCARIGFTFGGGTGYGHGVSSDGAARFVLLSFAIEG